MVGICRPNPVVPPSLEATSVTAFFRDACRDAIKSEMSFELACGMSPGKISMESASVLFAANSIPAIAA